MPYIFINEFEIVDSENKQEIKEEPKEINPYEEMGKQIEIAESDLPF